LSPVLRFVIIRLGRALLTLLLSSFLIFGALYLTPGTPLAFLVGGHTLSPADLAALKEQYHLNQPFFERYVLWLGDVLHGNFGESIVFRESVSSLLAPRIGSTLLLVVYAAILIIVFGIGLGVLSATRPGRLDTSVTVGTTVGLATPTFVMAIVLISVFSVTLGWFPSLGSGSGLFDRVWHLTLPAIALAVSGLAYMTQTSRAALRAELGQEHVLTAQARGLPRSVILRHHVLRNAAIPIATVGGVTIASLFAAVAVVEVAFGLQGIGSYLIQSVSDKDFAVVQAISLILVTAFIVTNTIVDILYHMLDPRLRVRAQT
jgi:peptide/nickel transport system permease protein